MKKISNKTLELRGNPKAGVDLSAKSARAKCTLITIDNSLYISLRARGGRPLHLASGVLGGGGCGAASPAPDLINISWSLG